MPLHVMEQGEYELFETTNGHRMLVLNGERLYAWVQGQEGEILVRSDSDHRRDRTIRTGRFYVIDFEENPTYKDMPHLFLQNGDAFEEAMLPNGLPSDEDVQTKVVRTDDTIRRVELEDYLDEPVPARPGESRQRGRTDRHANGDREVPLASFDDLTVDQAKARLDGLSDEQLRRLRSYEQQHKSRKTLLQAIDRRLG